MNYDFSQFNDKEFEEFSIDLLSVHLGKRIERFKPGRDSGVDGRYYSEKKEEIIIQCKHYLKTGYRGLISKIKRDEKKNVKKLDPKKYIFITSLTLSRANKNEINEIFSPYIERDDDIYGHEDLNSLLSDNPKIEEKYYKLWIGSTNVMKRMINNAILGRSKFEIEQIVEKSKKYIQTENHNESLKILQEKNVVIISGEPGIGKTSLAENLSLQYFSKDYEFFDIEESISEAENVFIRGKKQIFYFDDFLGSNYFEAIENKKDSHIIKFINRVRKDAKKKFILTTRTNILNSGMVYSSLFSVNKLRKHEFLLSINKINDLDKAKILYNHIWFSNLKEEYIEEIYKDKRYLSIIKHQNYNPRLIEFITDLDRITVSPSEYWEYILKTLEEPKDIWRDCFKTQNNEFVRIIVNLVVYNGTYISENDLRYSFSKIIEIEHLKSFSHTEKDFSSIARLATGSFLNRTKSKDKVLYTVFNPSIADYILGEYNSDSKKLLNIYRALDTVKSLEKLKSLKTANELGSDTVEDIFDQLFYNELIEKKNYDYTIWISYYFKEDGCKENDVVLFLDNIIKNPKRIYEVEKFLTLINIFHDKLDFSSIKFLDIVLNDNKFDFDEIDLLLNLCEIVSSINPLILDITSEIVQIYLSEEITQIADEIDLSPAIAIIGDDGYSDYVINDDMVINEISQKLQSLINKFESDVINELDIDIDNMIEEVCVDDLLTSYIDSQAQDEEGYGFSRSSNTNYDNAIQDLFEKT